MAYVCLDHNDNGDDGGMEKEKKIRSRKKHIDNKYCLSCMC